MIYYSNGGFNWNDVYFMPTKLREFYFGQLLKVKDTEKQSYEKASKSAKTKSITPKTTRS